MQQRGEVTERLKVRLLKGCGWHCRPVGSNPTLSAWYDPVA